jgi:nitrogen fixation/metabolism regulation signal transduction histidine kinase
VLLALFLSKYITKSLSRISQKIKSFNLEKTNPKISLKRTGVELKPLITAYNEMIDELEDSAQKLAETERQEAWQLMARQVAHEIKNPLTPMRLSVQSFQSQYQRNKITKTDVDEFSKTMIQQIDTLSTIATAFSDFAKMPDYQVEIVEVNEVIKFTLDIFKGEDIIFSPHETPLYVSIDKTRLIRVITNLIKNAIQATKDNEHCHVEISVKEENESVIITVKDNGTGIPTEIIDRIFEPQFTTKSSGMGLGLSMVKKIIDKSNGKIEVISEPNQPTIFKISLPKITTE